ncbi:hypothetical protein [Streptomyces sp. NPDC014733]|uniref:hypothetical protein n=1 Tax=Streptomyces sp. NPDC014733 TaxID=3364885 RepID=UPI0036FB2DB5
MASRHDLDDAGRPKIHCSCAFVVFRNAIASAAPEQAMTIHHLGTEGIPEIAVATTDRTTLLKAKTRAAERFLSVRRRQALSRLCHSAKAQSRSLGAASLLPMI